MSTVLNANGLSFSDGSYFNSIAPTVGSVNAAAIGCLTFAAPGPVNSTTTGATSYYGTFYTVAGSNFYIYNNYYRIIPQQISNTTQTCPFAGNASGSWRSMTYATISGLYFKSASYFWPLLSFYRYA